MHHIPTTQLKKKNIAHCLNFLGASSRPPLLPWEGNFFFSFILTSFYFIFLLLESAFLKIYIHVS